MDQDYLPSPEIRFYNRLKNFFRQFENRLTSRRMVLLRSVIDHFYRQGKYLAFDILGSMNFGISQQASDVDIVLYYHDYSLQPASEERTSQQLIRSIHKHFERLRGKFDYAPDVQVVDYINLKRIEMSIFHENPACVQLQSFLLYRTIGRAVHYRLLREKEDMLVTKPDLMMYLEESMRDTFRELLTNPTSRYSFTKYRERFQEQGLDIPVDIQEMFQFYLQDELPEL